MIFEIKQGEESLTSHSGLALVGALLEKTELQERIDNVKMSKNDINLSEKMYFSCFSNSSCNS